MNATTSCHHKGPKYRGVLSTTTDVTARDLKTEYGGLLEKTAKRINRSNTSCGVDDLVQAGWLGLIEAARFYDADNPDNLPLWRYAKTRVRGAMFDELRDQSYFSRGVGYRLTEFCENIHAGELPDPYVQIRRDFETRWVEMLAALSGRDRQIMTLYTVRGVALHRIGGMYDITTARVQQVIMRCQKRLRSDLP